MGQGEQGLRAFVPADEAADRAAVGYLADALKNLHNAIAQAERAGWGSNIRADMESAAVLVAFVVGSLA